MKTLKAKCKHCGKEITSLYENQLKQNIQAHEIACKENPENKEEGEKK